MTTDTRRAFADDLQAGDRYQFGSFTITEAGLIDFATVWDPQGFHVDAATADVGAFGGLIASGIHTLAVFQRLAVRAVFDGWQVIAGRRLVDVAFLRPVRPGDTLTGSMTIDTVTFDKPGRALVTCAGSLVNGDDREVLSTTMEVFVRARD
ncbi:MaoC/PaaZ C-terminal domain-containing protein [Gordonia sp. LSe1-13]|uniref:MaoC/PaaZ C-terminal domain-containing protein n=1 Tax=Gordonia sesuvii TaxID=3116777 RepID=A0ABU7M9B2_9ACTN|nr:MaoC/PaaZ C-terminal domain-containing protein [Gordonia sp. LSe1-13]